jgi:hypothetical protein
VKPASDVFKRAAEDIAEAVDKLYEAELAKKDEEIERLERELDERDALIQQLTTAKETV